MKRIVMLLLIISLASAMVFSAEAMSDADTEFLAELAFQLRERGWDDETLEPLLEHARLMHWDEAPAADPAVIAFALHYGTADAAGEPGDLAALRARLAWELRFTAAEMTRLGYGAQAIAQGAARGVAETVAEMKAEGKPADADPPGLAVRETVKERVANEVAARAQSEHRVGAETRLESLAKGRPEAPGSSNRPGTPGGPPKR